MSKDPYPIPNAIQNIPKCWSPEDCVSLGYFILGDDEPIFHEIMKDVAVSNHLDFQKDVKMLI